MKRPEWRDVWNWLKQGFHGLLVFLGAIYFVSLILIAMWFLGTAEDVPDRTVLEVDFERSYPERVPADPVDRSMAPDGPTVRELVSALDRAADDERVLGLVARIGDSGMGLARLQELRDAILAFRESGKPTVAWAETFGEFGPANGAYYLATAFEETHLQPSGDVGLTGLLVQSPFLAEGLDKIGVEMVGDQRYEYKSAYNTFVDTAYTEAHAEATGAVMRSQFGQMLRGIGEGRGLDSATVEGLFDRGPYFGQEAVEAGLVDRLAYRDEVHDRLRERVQAEDEETELLGLAAYAGRTGGGGEPEATVALIQEVGPVVRGSGSGGAFSSPTIASKDVTAHFRAAVDDEDVDAILFRVESPGGSYVASDAIWRSVVRAREEGKPVVVSMGDVAGSGGYFVAMAADRIVAQPGTITGSIGVLNVKPVTAELWEKLGIDWGQLQTSENAEMWSGLEGFDPAEWERLQAWLDRVYVDFTGKVAEGRGLSRDSVHAVARGRIWTGEQAARIGLVDDLGGYPAAYAALREELELEEDARLRLKAFPPERSWWDRITERGDDDRERLLRATAQQVRSAAGPALRLARRLGLVGTGVLTTPELYPRP